ncbi:hypothetical protein JL720_14407 [Aureococcus anophagefferens]|nr:hypothetical protein JL720_14407 [Aureococcus anophagefferens]
MVARWRHRRICYIPRLADAVEDDAASFLKLATLSRTAFFQFLDRGTGCGDVGGSPFATSLYAMHCEGGDAAAGVTFGAAKGALGRAVFDRASYGSGYVDAAAFDSVLAQILTTIFEDEGSRAAGASVAEAVEALGGSRERAETFLRYDSSGDGRIDLGEAVAMALSLGGALDAFLAAAERRKSLELSAGEVAAASGGSTLGIRDYNVALRLIGFGDVARVFQGQFVQGIFQRLDVDGDGEVRLPEFLVNAARLMRPVSWERSMRDAAGFPGLGALVVDDGAEDIRHFVASLQTGDIILSKIDDDMGRYLQFAMDAPWSHVAVVVRGAAPAPGAPNEKTEELLETFPFRRRSHAFCSPGSCVCFPWSHEDASSTVEPGFFGGGKAAKSFPASCLRCDAGVHLLESTGEGIHVYDFAHRYFESKITTRDEFTHAIEYHSRRGSVVAADAADMEHRSHFCSKVVAEFLQHMGWLGAGREPGSVMPSDYATCAGQHRGVLRRDVEADLADGVALGPLEIIWTPELGAHLPYRARKKK